MTPKVARDDPDGRVMHDLVRCPDTGAISLLSGRNALQATELIFGAYEAAWRGERVHLPLEGVTGHPLVSILRAAGMLLEGVFAQ